MYTLYFDRNSNLPQRKMNVKLIESHNDVASESDNDVKAPWNTFFINALGV
jgi:hypothetical protein